MAHLTNEALEHFAAHHGVASTAALVRCGLTTHGIREHVESGNLAVVLRGVYRNPAVPFDELARCAAVCAAHPDVAIAGPTAGRLWGFRRMPADLRIHILAPPASQRTVAQWVRPYRTAAVHEEDFVPRPDGIVVTTRPRTALDLARHLAPLDLLSVIEQAMKDGRHTTTEMRAVAVDWRSPQRPWLRRYLERIDSRVDGGAAESHPEVVLGNALAKAGVAGLVRQFDIELPGFGRARFDIAIPALQWAIEVDVFPTHRETNGRRRDQLRDAAAGDRGWLVTRITEADLGRNLDATVGRLQSIHRHRLPSARQR